MILNDKDKQAFSARLNKILDLAGVPESGKGRQGALAKTFNVSDKGARKWIVGEAVPRYEMLKKITEKYKKTGVTVEWLLSGDPNLSPFNALGANENSATYTLHAHKIKGLVPVLSTVQAGQWCEEKEIKMLQHVEKWIPCISTHGENTYALRVEGDSMTSTHGRSYPEGCYILVDPDKVITNGCRVVATIALNNEVTFKEYRHESGKHYLKPLNSQYPIIEMTPEMKICGVVIGMFQEE